MHLPIRALPAAIVLLASLQLTFAQTPAFTYQGFLTDSGGPANGVYDLQFNLFNVASGGGALTGAVPAHDLGVTNGLFTVTLDFTASPFTGQTLWLEIAVRPGASMDAYTNLVPRQPITSAPYAIKAANAMTVAMGTISDPSFIGTTTTAPLLLQVSNTVGLRLEYPTVGSVPNLVGGFSGNSVGAGTEGAVIAGGGSSGANENTIGLDSDYSAIGGGENNNIASNSAWGTIAGGAFNDIGVNATHSAIGGGTNNDIADNSRSATIAGGVNNDIGVNSDFSAIGGGNNNDIASNSFYATIAGGVNNDIRVDADYSAIGGGADNIIANNSTYATIAGGHRNDIFVDSDYSAIGGGEDNNIASNSAWGTIAGGYFNDIGANASYSAIGGGADNNIALNSFYATIAGGVNNDIGSNADYSAIGGGVDNNIAFNSFFATIAGGGRNDIDTNCSYGAIGGGADNIIRIDSLYATIAGGFSNYIDGSCSYGAIGGGSDNRIGFQALYAVIPGGYSNSVGGSASFAFAAGRRAKAFHRGAFVWADSQDADFQSSGTDSFNVRAQGGVRFFSNSGLTTGVTLAAGANAWAAVSDRNAKKNFVPVDGLKMLEQLARMPVQRWNYKAEPDDAVPHIGPMAQDFKAAFYPGRDDKTISTMEFDGVALAAIQGLNQKVEEREALLRKELQRRDAELAELKQKNTEMETRLNALEKLMKRLSVAQNGGGE